MNVIVFKYTFHFYLSQTILNTFQEFCNLQFIIDALTFRFSWFSLVLWRNTNPPISFGPKWPNRWVRPGRHKPVCTSRIRPVRIPSESRFVDPNSSVYFWCHRIHRISPVYRPLALLRGSMSQIKSNPRRLVNWHIKSGLFDNKYQCFIATTRLTILTTLWSRLQFVVVIVANAIIVVDLLASNAVVAESTTLALTCLFLEANDSLCGWEQIIMILLRRMYLNRNRGRTRAPPNKTQPKCGWCAAKLTVSIVVHLKLFGVINV